MNKSKIQNRKIGDGPYQIGENDNKREFIYRGFRYYTLTKDMYGNFINEREIEKQAEDARIMIDREINSGVMFGRQLSDDEIIELVDAFDRQILNKPSEDVILRVKDEIEALRIKLNDLNKFMETKKFFLLNRIDKDLLYDQQVFMTRYLQTLGKRYERMIDGEFNDKFMLSFD